MGLGSTNVFLLSFPACWGRTGNKEGAETVGILGYGVLATSSKARVAIPFVTSIDALATSSFLVLYSFCLTVGSILWMMTADDKQRAFDSVRVWRFHRAMLALQVLSQEPQVRFAVFHQRTFNRRSTKC